MESICIEFGVCKIHVAGDIVFVSSEKKEELRDFSIRNTITLSKHSWNWDWILEPYLDTEFTAANEKMVEQRLVENGFKIAEIENIRNEVGKQMLKYNFNTMLWDWSSLGLADVLSAMRAKYNRERFRAFYMRALEIELRAPGS
ncbi:hypothetical protein ACFSQJ_03830 [Croceitalea marina]|uniref:Uncharacterized protein n=1 Tax=Croceitalea marina TaxID=1775166 RepID=A0ABW5MV41_9FLAO